MRHTLGLDIGALGNRGVPAAPGAIGPGFGPGRDGP